MTMQRTGPVTFRSPQAELESLLLARADEAAEMLFAFRIFYGLSCRRDRLQGIGG